MGGAAAGEVAAQMAADAIYEALTAADAQPRDGFARLLRRAVQRANERIFIQSRDNQSERGMGTTCTAAGLVDDTLVVAQIGDSRCYVLRDGKLAQVTKDQSLAWQLIEAGAMTAEEAKAFEHANIILQALGVQEHVEVVLSQVQLRKGDVALLCSDGLHGPVTDEEILSVLVTEPDLQKAGEALIQKALDRDGPDNITVALARFDGEALQAGRPGRHHQLHRLRPRQRSGPGADGDDRRLERRPRDGRGAAADRPARRRGRGPDQDRRRTIRAGRAGCAPGAPRRRRRPRGVPSLLALFLIGLVAAAAGGIFVMKCERDQSTRSDGRVTLP